MQESSTLAGLIQETLDAFFTSQREALEDLGPDVPLLIDSAQDFLTGGKRLRARFMTASYECVASSLDPMLNELPKSVLWAACSLELFHAAALIHDDLIDHSDTRRGKPAIHKTFEAKHLQSDWQSDASHFGVSSAILIGDLLQSWADEMFNEALSAVGSGVAEAARGHFNRMRSEVAAGQYLDVLEEQRGDAASSQEELERATRVLIYKSAKYSVEAPLLIGAALAGATAEQEQVFRDFGLPIGVAFQLRDDLLGVFGDSAVTGKPSGDDLREGKRTVLISLTRKELPTSQRNVFDEMLGDASLTGEQIAMMQRTILDSGAVDSVETMIANNVTRASSAINRANFSAHATQLLTQLAERATQRSA